MSDDDGNKSDIVQRINKGEYSDNEDEQVNEKDKEIVVNAETQKETEHNDNKELLYNQNLNPQQESLIENKEDYNKEKVLIRDTIQQTTDNPIPIESNSTEIKNDEKVNNEEKSDNGSDSDSVDSNIKAIAQDNESDSEEEQEKEEIKKDTIINTAKQAKVIQKEVKDSIIEEKELIQAITEPQKSKNNNNDNNLINNSTLLLDNYKPNQTTFDQSKNKNEFFKSNINSNDDNNNNQKSIYLSYNQQRNYNDNYHHDNNNSNNYSNRNNNNYRDNRPSFNQRRFNNNNFSNNNSNRPLFTSQTERIENDPLYKENRLLIHEIINCFPSFSDIEILRIIKTINQGPKQTMFEIMNHIFREHAIGKTNKLLSRYHSQRKYEDIIDINETSYPEDLVAYHMRILKQYKIYTKPQCIEKNIPEEYAYNSIKDQRRLLKKDIDGNYNYIPRESTNSNNSQPNPDDYYSLNQNEINYHSLVFHTRVCRKRECNELICPNAHSLSSDFRILYDYKNIDICMLMNNISNSKMVTVIESYLEHFPIPISFNLFNFKIFKCDTDHKLDRRLCPRYHNQYEKRRPPEIFRYSNTSCPNALYNNDYEVSRCKSGDYCHQIHSKYEYNYHQDNFRYQYPCAHEKKGVCPYYRTCYGYHRKEYKDDKDDAVIDTELENAKEVISNVIICKICNELPTELNYVYYTTCYHYCCEICFKKSVAEGRKCLFCGVEFDKKKLMRMFFSNTK